MPLRVSSDVPMSEQTACHHEDMDADSTLLSLQRGLVSDDPKTRADSADGVTDVHRDLSVDDVAVLALLLGALRVNEQDGRAAEAQLHALSELAEWHDLPTAAFHIAVQPPHVLAWAGSELEYVDYLREQAAT